MAEARRRSLRRCPLTTALPIRRWTATRRAPERFASRAALHILRSKTFRLQGISRPMETGSHMMRGSQRVVEEDRPWYIIDPDSYFWRMWNILQAVSILYLVVSTPSALS